MGAQIFNLHWKATKWPLLPFLVVLAGIPLLTARLVWSCGDQPAYGIGGGIIDLSTGIGIMYPILACLIGATVALTAWNWDHQTNHVYALTLPLARARYAALKFASGVAILALPMALLYASALVATWTINLPAGLNTYAGSLSLQFFLASLTAYGIIFALAAGRMRTAVITLSAFSMIVIFGSGLADFAQDFVPGMQYVDISGIAVDFLINEWGPFHVFGGNWSLIDV